MSADNELGADCGNASSEAHATFDAKLEALHDVLPPSNSMADNTNRLDVVHHKCYFPALNMLC